VAPAKKILSWGGRFLVNLILPQVWTLNEPLNLRILPELVCIVQFDRNKFEALWSAMVEDGAFRARGGSKKLIAFRCVCWFSWAEQTKSMENLLQYDFEWILPGHGERAHLPVKEMAVQMADLVSRMKKL
jgi:hypothetical protein